jgi:exosortase B
VVLAVLCGVLAVLYVPTVWSLWHSLWQDPAHSHGPIVLAVVAWLAARGVRHHLNRTTVVSTEGLGWAVAALGVGLMAYTLGRSQSLYVLEVGSAIPVLIGLIWLAFGRQMVLRLWFPIFFILFLVPLPGSLIDTITHPLKLAVSWASEHLLATMGYPVARSGVILTIGPYQMFVADACAGLTSLFMLEAFGLLYLNVVRHASALRNVILAVLIVPISFASNVIRVILLCLVTFHWGDAAGQGFLHDFSGTVLFAAALALTVAADTGARALVRGVRRWTGRPATPDDEGADSPGLWPPVAGWQGVRWPMGWSVTLGALALAALTISVWLTPRPVAAQGAGDLERLIPTRLGDWVMLDRAQLPVDVLANEPGETTLNNPYDQVVMRSYRHASTGQVVDLAVAYGKHQRQEVKIHQPELCFNSQGFRVLSRGDTVFQRPTDAPGPVITGKRLYSEGRMAKLAATYWIRIGSVYADSAWETRWEIFREGTRGRAVDGVLVRATMPVSRADQADEAQVVMQGFLAQLLQQGSPELRRALAP